MSSIQTLLETMRMLRDKDNGCPWDIEQTLESLSSCVIEEAYEVSDAIAKKNYGNLKEELGDVVDAAKDVVDQTKDVAAAVKGKPRRGRKPKANK